MDTVVKIAQLLLSHRIAANVVLGFGILIGTVAVITTHVAWEAAVSSVPALGTSPVLLVLIMVLIVVSYSLAHLINGVVIFLGRSGIGKIRSYRAVQEARIQDEEQKQVEIEKRSRAEGHLRSVLPHLPAAHRRILVLLSASTSGEARLSRNVAPYKPVAELQEHGFVEQVAAFGRDEFLLRLIPNARQPVADFIEAESQREAAAKRKRIADALKEADSATKTLLELFGIGDPESPEEPLHAWMEHPVYASIQPLIRLGALVYETGGRSAKDPEHTERLNLTPEAVEPVEQLILGRPVARKSILLDRRQIASSVVGGSGSGRQRSLADGIPWPVQGSGN